MTHLRIVKPATKPERTTHSTVDTIMITNDMIKDWKIPPWQRPIRVNEKVVALVPRIKEDGGVLPGVLTLGVHNGTTYVVDGQHRLHAFGLTELREGYADVRIVHFDTMADMATEFVELNSKIVSFRPDDILRGLEPSHPTLRMIRTACPFVGYDMIRRGDKSPILSMSAVLRMWAAATMEVPMGGGMSAMMRAQTISEDEAKKCAAYLDLCMRAWGRDREYDRLWGGLNLSLVGWLYRRLVLGQAVTNYKRHIRLSADQFTKAAMALSTSDDYLSWLIGRQLTERDRSPAFNRIKILMVRRLETMVNGKVLFPLPAWATRITHHQ